ncbi:MAG: hypothetical protein LBO74_12035 [Candidatus Symbiothrix sp.]|jgi:thymidylate kinase|nr:hypothetical protein [Candidatus Symbiothrix sp.]
MQNKWGKIHTTALLHFFDRLNQEHIDWLVVRNYEGLPDNNPSKDVDLAIAKQQWKQADIAVKEIFQEFGFSHYVLHKFQFIQCYLFINVEDGISLKLDFFDCNEYIGLQTHSFDLLNSRKELYNSLYVANPLHIAVTTWLRPLLGGAYVKEKYISDILACYTTNKTDFRNELVRLFGVELTDKILLCFEQNELKQTLRYRKEIIKDLFVRSLKDNPAKTIYHVIKHYMISFQTKFKLVNPDFIAVEGADGTGKSTFIDGLQKAIAYYYVSDETKCHIYHHRPSILPNLGALGEKAGVKEQDTDFTNPHRGKPKGFISSLLRMIYYWVDYLIGVPFFMRKDVQFDKFTIYDRYVYDFLVDPYRASIKLPYWIRKIFTKLVIQPRIVFVLLTDAETIYKRKQELTIDEINRQLGEFLKLAKSNKRFVVIDAALSPDEMVDKAMKVIIEKFTYRII